jgi:hypothetical protein
MNTPLPSGGQSSGRQFDRADCRRQRLDGGYVVVRSFAQRQKSELLGGPCPWPWRRCNSRSGRRLIATERFESVRVSQFCGALFPQTPHVEPDVAVGHLVEEHVFGLARLLRSS